MPKPRLILLIRHGESESNCDKSVNCHTPNHKVPLTDRGHQQAFEAGVKLKDLVQDNEKVCFYTSPYLRTRQTLQGIINGFTSENENENENENGNTDKHKNEDENENENEKSIIEKDSSTNNKNYVVYEEPRMREQDFGNFQGTAQEMKAIWLERAKYGHFFYRIPHGESAADVYDRCSSFNETLFRQFSRSNFPQILVLVTHGIWARVFLQRWFRWSVEYFEDLTNIPHCEWIILELTETHEDINANTNNLDHHHDEHETRYHLKTVLKHWDDNNNDNTSTTNKTNSRDTLIYPYN